MFFCSSVFNNLSSCSSYLFFINRKTFLLIFFLVWGLLQIYNNRAITERLQQDYELSETDAKEMLRLDDFVRENPDSTFLVLESEVLSLFPG